MIFVDIMFHKNDPSDTLMRLCSKAEEHAGVDFVVIDHHPHVMPPDLTQAASNLRIQAVDQVYDCCFGDPSDELMIPAALCENEVDSVADRMTDQDRVRALGVARAAADRGGLAGERLIRLLASEDWSIIEALGSEESTEHRFVRGIRPKNYPPSPALAEARAFTRAFDPGESPIPVGQ